MPKKVKNVLLKKDLKFWIYHNLKSFYKADPYFKHFPTDVILGNFKGLLLTSSSVEDLILNLKKSEINASFKLFRKMDGSSPLYFKYPSLDFQVESLLACWKEIKKIEKKIRHFNSIGNDIENNINLFSDGEDAYSDDNHNSFLFGLRPNLINFFGITDEDDVTLYSYEMSKVGTIRADYKTEYDAFRRNVRTKTANVAKNDGVGFFFQTDIKKFYHSITPKMAIIFLKSHYPDAKEIIKCLEKLELDREDELPIGWIISGTIAYLILTKFHEILKVSLPECIEELNVVSLKNTTVEITSYVDDFIFVVKTKTLLDVKDKIALEKCILECSEDAFDYLLGSKVVLFHKTSVGGKNKSFDITSAFAEIVDSNFFDFITGTSVHESDGLDIFDELMLPGDNNLIINEKVQFLKSISSARSKMDEIVNGPPNDFNQMFKKIIYKIDTDGMKYIQSVISLLGVYFNELKIQGKYDVTNFSEKIKMIEDRVFATENVSSDLVIKYFMSFKKIVSSKSSEELQIFLESFRKCKKLIKTNNHCTSFDYSLLELLSEQIRADFLISGIKSVDFRVTRNDSVLPFFLTFQKYVDLVSVIIGNNLDFTMKEHEVFVAVEAMKKVNLSLTITKKEDFLYSATFKVLGGAENKRRFFNLLMPEAVYLFMSSLTISGRERFLVLVKKYNNYEPFFQEIIYQLENIEQVKNIVEMNTNRKLAYWLSSVGHISGDKNKKNKFKKLSIFSSSYLEHRMYLLESVIFISYSMKCNDLDDFWRILFFRYTSIDSSFNLSWKGLSSTYSPASLGIGTILKLFLREKLNNSSSVLRDSLGRILDKSNKSKSGLDDIVTSVKFDDFMMEFNVKHLFDKEEIKITIVSLPLDPNPNSPECNYDFEEGAVFKEESVKFLNNKILKAIRHAKNEGSDVIIFPELSIPRKYLDSYLREAGDGEMIFIGGLEYSINGVREIKNEIVISLPTKRSHSLTGKSFWPISQLKIYPSTDEYYELTKRGYTFKGGNELIVFKSNYWKNFSVLNCVDFFSLRLKRLLQGQIQTLFVPALNYDSTTFHHLAQACVRELFTYCVICNSQSTGVSSVLGPFRNNKERTVFSKEGKSLPEYSTLKINPTIIDSAQNNVPTTLFKADSVLGRFKQLPPDWKKIV